MTVRRGDGEMDGLSLPDWDSYSSAAVSGDVLDGVAGLLDPEDGFVAAGPRGAGIADGLGRGHRDVAFAPPDSLSGPDLYR